MVNKDIYSIFEAYNSTPAAAPTSTAPKKMDRDTLKKKYEDGLKAITDSGLPPEAIENLTSSMKKEWEADKETYRNNLEPADLEEIDQVLGIPKTSTSTPPATPSTAAPAPTTSTPVPAAAPAATPTAPTTQNSLPTVTVPKPGTPTVRPPVAPSPTLPTTSQSLNPQDVIDQERQRAQAAEQPDTAPDVTLPPPVPKSPTPPNPNVQPRTGTYSDVPAPTTNTPTPGVNVPKPGQPTQPTTSTGRYWVNTTKGPRMASKNQPGAFFSATKPR